MKYDKSLLNGTCNMVNTALPYIMHIDLNSCFAIIEQQANRLLRGRPVGVAAYDTPRGFVLAASYEAKTKGVKLGVNVEQSRAMAPGMVIMTPDPAKYRTAHKRFKKLMLEYTPDVAAKSIDEFVLDLSSSPVLKKAKNIIKNCEASSVSHESRDKSQEGVAAKHGSTHDSSLAEEMYIHNQAMLEIGKEIKAKIRERLGEFVTVNIGIAPNRFLAKYAAGFDKPDGMTLIDHANLKSKYENMKLVDLPGINVRFRARLRAEKIYTPLDFLGADMTTLKKRVFKSINGYHWYMRLRGFEADAVEFRRKRIGHQHAIKEKVTDVAMLERLLMKLCEKTGRRLRNNNYYGGGIHLYVGFAQSNPQSNNNSLSRINLDSEQRGDPYRQHYLEDGSEGYKKKTKRKNNKDGHVHAGFNLGQFRSWHHGEKVPHRLYSTPDIYLAAKKLLHSAVQDSGYGTSGEFNKKVKIMAVHVYNLEPWDPVQLNLFEQTKNWQQKNSTTPLANPTGSHPVAGWDPVEPEGVYLKSMDSSKRISDAVDGINDRYGEFVITPALMMEMQGTILDRVAFGNVRDV